MEGSGGRTRGTLNLCHKSQGDGDGLGAEAEASCSCKSRGNLRKTRMKGDMGTLPGSLLSKVTVEVPGREQV